MTNWRSTVLGFLLGVALYLAQAGPKCPETKQDWWALGIACLAAGLGYVCKDATAKKALPVVLLALALTGCSGLGILQNPASDPSAQLAIMQQANARGCVYFKGNAAPWANVTTILVGTWGQAPPTYAECWKGMPVGMP